MGPHTRDDEFTAFVADHGRELSRYAVLLTGDQSRAQDVLQEAFTRLYVQWSRTTIDRALPYTRRIIANLVIDEGRRAHRRREVPSDQLEGTADPRPAAAIGAVELRGEIAALLASLSPRERSMVVLRYAADLSDAAVAEELGVSIGTVKSTCSRALARLRTHSENARY